LDSVMVAPRAAVVVAASLAWKARAVVIFRVVG
jgi:hypothetical protein